MTMTFGWRCIYDILPTLVTKVGNGGIGHLVGREADPGVVISFLCNSSVGVNGAVVKRPGDGCDGRQSPLRDRPVC